MKQKSPEHMATALAELFMGKRVESQKATQALELICEVFSFDGGLIYEIDQDNIFHLIERVQRCDAELHESFPVDNLTSECRNLLANELLCRAGADALPALCDRELLEMFFAKSLVAVSIVDETQRIFGLIILTRLDAEKKLADVDIQALRIALSMLENYVGIRVYQNKLAFAKVSLESILDNTGIDIYVNDFNTHDILYVNKSMAAPYGGAEQFVGHKCWQVLFPGQTGPCAFCPQTKIVDDDGNPTKTYTWDYQRPFDGAWFRVFSSAFRWVDGRLAHVVSSADITDNKRNEELVQYLANYDSLTSLPNRRMLVSECERRLSHANPDEKGFLLFFDIDGFKAINDSYGHDAGDEFLIKLGEFFTGIPMLKNAIYRNGGDEFVALLGGDITEVNISYLASFIHERFKKPWVLKKANVFCSTSIGVACYPDDGTTAEALLHAADQAMYHVKKTGGGSVRFAHELE